MTAAGAVAVTKALRQLEAEARAAEAEFKAILKKLAVGFGWLRRSLFPL